VWSAKRRALAEGHARRKTVRNPQLQELQLPKRSLRLSIMLHRTI